jgi:glycosyltransferase involved in cell wall biosynthesis
VHHLAYVFERFPTFTQTFCVREILELERQGLNPLIFSVRDTRHESPRHFPDELYHRVHFLPAEKELIAIIKEEKDANRLPQQTVLSLRHWGERPDKMRVYEAAYIGQKMRAANVWHAHAHFAGIGARVCWWLKYCHDFTFSFTGHANDIFCEEAGLDLTLARLMRDAALVITVSDFSARQLRGRFPAAARKIRRVYNGLDVEHYALPRRESEPPLILSAGRLIEKKGFAYLISACARLVEGGHKFRCEIAGDGPLEDELRSRIERLRLGDSVTLLGARPQEDIIRRLGEARVFALACATDQDGGKDNLPTVIMEAMAAGVPCVSTRVAGVPEMVEDGVTGALVEEGKPDDFSRALEKFLRDRRLCAQMGEAGRQRAERLFSQQANVGRLRRFLIGRGAVRLDSALIAHTPRLALCYGRQALVRLGRLARFQRFRHRRAPEFLFGGCNPPLRGDDF